jgi:hypothetical protein
MKRTAVLNVGLLLSFLFVPSAASSVSSSELFRIHNERQLQDDDVPLVCPFDEERLYYNIDIFVEATAENCDDYDLVGIGEVLQQLVSTVEAEIPQYEETERMETFVCPRPAMEQDLVRKLRAQSSSRRRFLQAVAAAQQTTPQQTQPVRKRRGRKRKRYTYKGSGRCRRCKANNSDRRRVLQAQVKEICNAANEATQAASNAAKTLQNAETEFDRLKLFVLNNCNYTTTSGLESILQAKEWLKEIDKFVKIAKEDDKKATHNCNMGKRASDPKRREPIRSNTQASKEAVDSVKIAQMTLSRLQDFLLESDSICENDESSANDSDDISVDAVCDEADLAESVVELVAATVVSGKESLSQLKELAWQCSNLGSAQGLFFDAEQILHELHQALKIAQTIVDEKAANQCQLAKEAASDADLTPYVKEAQDTMATILDITARADLGRLELAAIVETMNICDAPPPLLKNEASVEAVCERSDSALFFSQMADTIFMNANKTFEQLEERALECNDLERGEVWVVRAKEFLSLCQQEQEMAREQAKVSKSQCDKAQRAESDMELREYFQIAQISFKATRNAAEDVKQRYAILLDELERDLCSQGRRKMRQKGVTAEMVCQYAQVATSASGLVASVFAQANDARASLQETAMDCTDSYSSQEPIEAANEWLVSIQKSLKVASNGARKANLECNKANRVKSPEALRNCLNKAKRFARVALKAETRAETSSAEVKDIAESYYCQGMEEEMEAAADEDESYEEELTYEERTYEEGANGEGAQEEGVYVGGTYGYEEEGNIESGSSLDLWLNELSDILHKRIPFELVEFYGDTTDPDGCTLEAVIGYVEIQAYQESPPDFIEDMEDCAALGLE